MSRAPGTRNADFEATRTDLLDRILHAVATQPERTSFAELAEVAGVSRTTLRHYFASRDALMHALIEHMRTLSDRAGAAYPVSSALALEEALRLALHRLVFAWRVGMGALFTAGLLWGLGDEALGPAYVSNMLEPMLTSFERLVAERLGTDARERGAEPLGELEVRHAALALVSPIVVALLHQDALRGASCRPLDVDLFVEAHLRRFLAAWAPSAPR